MASSRQRAPADSLTVLYTDNEEVHLTITLGAWGVPRRAELYRGARLLQRYGPTPFGTWTYYDAGLAPNATFTYQLQVYVEGQNTPTVYTVTPQTGRVKGTLTRSRTWAGGVWQGAGEGGWPPLDLTLDSNATLSIVSGATVLTTTIRSMPGSLVSIEGATLRNVSVFPPPNPYGAGYAAGGTASVKNSALENTQIYVGVISAFESNTGKCSEASNYPGLTTSRLAPSPQFNLNGNRLPGCCVSIGQVGQYFNAQDNTLKQMNLAGYGSLVVISNTITSELNIRNFSGALDVQGNRLAKVSLSNVGGEGPKTVRANDFVYPGGSIALTRVFHTRVEGNRLIECGYSGVSITQGSYNEIVGNKWVCSSGIGSIGVNIYAQEESADNNLVQDNVILAGVYGINGTYNAYDVGTMANTRIEHNEITCVTLPGQASCGGGGIYLSYHSGSQIVGNTVSGFFSGLSLYGPQAVVRDNRIISNTVNVAGTPRGSLVYNNAFVKGAAANAMQVNLLENVILSNTWSIAKTPGGNVVGGAYLGGNYWSDYDGVDADGDGLGDTPYIHDYHKLPMDPLPLIARPLPDLSVRYFVLDPTRARFDGASQRYLLPVDVTVANLGLADAANVPVRLSDNVGWSETQTIASLKVGASAALHLDWDITPILLPGKGRGALQLTVQADPANAIRELDETNNTRSVSALVDARPRVTEIRPDFTLASAYFLNNESVPNTIRAWVDWNGDLPGKGNPPYGKLRFNLNDVTVEENGQDWGGQHTYDMGADFRASFACANNTLRVTAALPVRGGEFVSPESVVQPTVFPFPLWVEWAIQNLPGSDASFETAIKAPLVEYTYDFKYPEPPFEATWTPPEWIPYLGGQELGIADTQAAANALGRSDGSGKARVEGQTALNLAALAARGSLWGEGDVQFRCGESLDLTRAQLGFNIKVPLEKEASLVDVVPAAKAAVGWPVIGRIIKWVIGIAKVKASLTPEVNVETVFEEQAGALSFKNGEGTGKLDARVALAFEPCQDLNAEVYGGGAPYVTVQVPRAPGYLKEVGIDLYYGASFQAWEFETGYERKINCHYPGGCAEIESDQALVASDQFGAPGWRLIPRNYEPQNLTGFGRSPGSHDLSGLQASAETVLLTGIYPRPEPALAVRGDGRRLLAFVTDDLTKPHGRGTEIAAFTYSSSAWSGPAALTNDQQPDFNPALAFDASGDGLLIWERSTLPMGITPTLDITFAASLEIAARTWNGASWSGIVTLTQNSLMDHAPQLAAGSDGAALALWQTNAGADALGTPAHPLTLTYALWNGSAWLTPTAAITGLHDVVNVAVAAYSSTRAALVYARDMDGLLTGTADLELFYSLFDGAAWSAPSRLTTDASADTTPALAFDADGILHLVWLRGDGVAWLRDSWDAADAQTINTGDQAGLLSLRLSRAADGNLSLVWQAMGASGSDLAYRVYDAASGAWSAQRSLTSDASVEAAHSPAFGADGKLYLAYQKVATQRVTRTFQISPTLSFTVTNLLVKGASDLAFLEHAVGRDLTWDSLAADPANPAPGQAVTLTAVLRNAGDLGVVNPQVTFYDDTTPIFTRTLAVTLGAGYTATVQANWLVPPTALPRTWRAVADPAKQVTETDENNNVIKLVTTLPDVRVEVFYVEHAADRLTLNVRLGNAGALTVTAPFTAAFRVADPLTGTQVATATVNATLGIGDQVAVTRVLTDLSVLAHTGSLWLPAGNLWLLADAGDTIVEADEANNADFAALKILPDLALSAADVSGEGALTATVYNNGYLTATDVLVEARRDGLTGTLLYSATLPAIASGASQAFTLSPPAGQYALFIKADPADAVAEVDESNNLAVVALSVAVQVRHKVYLPLALK